MSRHLGSVAAATLVLLAAGAGVAVAQDDPDRIVASGGIFVSGWAGTVDPPAAAAGMSIEHSRMAADGDAILVTTGPASTFWMTDGRLTGDYTVSATFHEPEYMNLNNHPHPYGIVIAGNQMGTGAQRYLYCAAYGDGRFIVRGFGPEPFQLNGRRGESHDAVNQAAGRNQPVTQQIAMTVRGGNVSCAINGTVVGTYPLSEVVADGRLATTDGTYGVRSAHNTDVIITGLTVTRH